MENVITRTFRVGVPARPEDLTWYLFTGEASAHTFRISGEDENKNPVPITGQIVGKFLAPNDIEIPLTGSLEDGVASVTLTPECYQVPGRFIVSVFSVENGKSCCIFCGVSSVFTTTGQAVAYPTTDLPDLVQLMAQADTFVNQQLAAIDAKAAAAIASIPSDYTALSNQVSELEFKKNLFQMKPIALTTGIYIRNKGGDTPTQAQQGNSGNFAAARIPCKPGDTFIVSGYPGANSRVWGFLDKDDYILTYSDATSARVVRETITAPANAAWLTLNTNVNSWADPDSYQLVDTWGILDSVSALTGLSTSPVLFNRQMLYRGSTSGDAANIDRAGYYKASGVDWAGKGTGVQMLYLRLIEEHRIDLSQAAVGDTLGYVMLRTSYRGSLTMSLGGTNTINAANGLIINSTVTITDDNAVAVIPFTVTERREYTGEDTDPSKLASVWFGLVFNAKTSPQLVEVSFFWPSAFSMIFAGYQNKIDAAAGYGARLSALETAVPAQDARLTAAEESVSGHETRLSAAEASAAASAAALTGLGKLYGGPTYHADIIFWGDSLTQGTGSSNNKSFAGYCADLLGVTRLNCGVGGESANTVACRQGGNLMMIPAGGINGTYPWSALLDLFGRPLNPRNTLLSTKGAQKAYVNGQEVTLSTHIAQNEEDTSTLTISGYTGTSAVPLPARFIGSTFQGKVHVIFVGTNGASVGSESDTPAAHIAIIDSMLAHIPHQQVVIMGLSRDNEALRADYDAAMLRHYGARFFPTRKMLVNYGLTLAGIADPTPQDTADVAEGRVPSSLRSDAVHLNDTGYSVLGTMLANFITTLGYQF